MIQIYHNTRCRKSRETLAFLKEQGIEPEIVEYLKTPPDYDTLKSVIQKLGIAPLELIRKKEQAFKDHYKGKELSDEEWIRAMVEHPKLIERPIVIRGDKAVIGRPREKVLELI
jgi:arsenate reductase